jgi:chemotaxis regulatin CheY-phosphate phosphatase CheZ
MNGSFKEKIGEIVDGKLTDQEIRELVTFFRYAFKENLDPDETDERFFRDLAFEMSASAKELAILIIEYRKDLKQKIHPGITDLTTVYIPEAADQLEGIIETTEVVANKIMDNLEIMQDGAEKMTAVIANLNKGRIVVPGEEQGVVEAQIDDETRHNIQSLINFMERAPRMKWQLFQIFMCR